MPTVKVISCYDPADTTLRGELEKHLENMKRQGQITHWHDHNISAGTEWEQEISINLNTADIILLLISPDFMHSDSCQAEMQQALARHEAGEAIVIPIILRYVDWKGAPFSKLQVLPTGDKPITSWLDYDEAFFHITSGIRRIVEELLKERGLDYAIDYRNSDWLPVLLDLTAGNAAQYWLHANQAAARGPQFTDRESHWLSSEMPLKDLPADEVQKFLEAEFAKP